MSLSPGDVIDGKYRIIRLIGEGGMGAVYEGENVRIHRRVAIKVLHAGVAENADAVQRFEREAQAAGRIGSEHIVEVLDLGNLPDGDRYMVMEFMDGDSLSERIRQRGRIMPSELYPISVAILEALKAAHGAGIIHRDLKPDNVFLLRNRARQPDFVKLLDFGISKFNHLSGESGFSMTRTGAVMGTPYYMSPEQAKGAKGMDHRADLYAVGVILYECVTGQVPFNADTFNELLFKIVLEEPPPLQQLAPDIDPGFAAIINKAMAREPAHRFQSAEEFQNVLQEWARTGATPEAVAAGARSVRSMTPHAQVGGSGAHAALGTGTPGTWSSTGSYSGATPQQPQKSKTGLFVALGAVLLVVVVGGAAAVTLGGNKEAEEARIAAAAAAASEQAAALESVKKAEEAARKAEEAARKAEEEAKRRGEEATQALTAEAKRAAEEARLQAEAEAKKAAEQAQAARQAVRAPAPAPRPKTAEKSPAEKPAASPPSEQTSGRKIRTEL